MATLNEDDKLRLSKLLRTCRVGLDLSQQQVADYLHIDRSTYAKYENGRMPDLKCLLDLAELYRVDVSAFASCFRARRKKPDIKPKLAAEVSTIQDDAEYLPMTDDEKRLLTYYRNSIRKKIINETAKLVMLEDAVGPWIAKESDSPDD